MFIIKLFFIDIGWRCLKIFGGKRTRANLYNAFDYKYITHSNPEISH